jgi:hypothetical protein
VPDRTWRRRGAVTGLFVVLTGVMTWPQPLVIATGAMDHQDIYFNVWRLRWIAHALWTSPLRLFDANIFFPERGVLAYSDAMLLEGVIAAPLLLAGLPPMLVHNLMLLGAIVASACGAFVLARHVYGSDLAGLIAGIVFSLAPYRFEHYMHMELQWTVWMPWAFWALQRTIETGRLRMGVLTGIFAALQVLSSIYYGIFLSILLAVVGGVQILTVRGRSWLPIVRALAAGALIAGAVSWAYSIPYERASARVGSREPAEVTMFSARPHDYLVAPADNLLYGDRSPGRPERRLHPGLLPVLLGLAALLLVPPRPVVIAYLVGAAAAFELSLGMYGAVYPVLYEHVTVLQGLRAPARASVLCLLFLGVLAGGGASHIAAPLRRRVAAPVSIAFVGILLLEYWVAPLRLVPYHNTPPPLYVWLEKQPPGVVAEFPMPEPEGLPGKEFVYAYMSTFHWKPLINGYSGYYPPSYVGLLARVADFPEPRAIEALRNAGVAYLIVHPEGVQDPKQIRIVERLTAAGLPWLASLDDGEGEAAVFGLR